MLIIKFNVPPSWSFDASETGESAKWQELHASPHIEHFPILSYPYICPYMGMSYPLWMCGLA